MDELKSACMALGERLSSGGRPKVSPPEGPAVWVGCLAAYNNGTLHGKWVEVDDDDENLREGIAQVLETSPEPGAEEFFFADQQLLPGVGEYTPVAEVCRIAEAVHKWGIDVCSAAREVFGDQWPHLLEAGAYQGEATSAGEWAAARAEEIGEELGPYAKYIDWETVARDMEYDGAMVFLQVGSTCYVFDGNVG